MEGDSTDKLTEIENKANFYPRPPGGGRPAGRRASPAAATDFYPRPPGGGRHGAVHFHGLCNSISIHALRVEGDLKRVARLYRLNDFYPRPPGGGRRPFKLFCYNREYDFYPRPPGGGRRIKGYTAAATTAFLSTPSGWRATKGGGWLSWVRFDFYPRPPGGGRLTSLLLLPFK